MYLCTRHPLYLFYLSLYIGRPTGDDMTKMMRVYEKMGLPGCIGSTDCVHLQWDRCPLSLTNLCKGKEGYPTLSYSCTVDHHRKILGVPRSNWGTRDDKTIVRVWLWMGKEEAED
jgi:hypothetical protein